MFDTDLVYKLFVCMLYIRVGRVTWRETKQSQSCLVHPDRFDV